ncbi:hypothetical protein [Mycolicibacterium baixiangningiae]|uniref:hypothetical protein n=1 Tax=Mycolicibacterium baixiangningiae TaxID=2761578 RepID=UPI001E4122C8|nr:hypothetical protein [Mycolicibacterium baixiangningiae]
MIAADLIRSGAKMSQREIARQSGISTATVRDVRCRLDRGDDPVPEAQKAHRTPHSLPPSPESRENPHAPSQLIQKRDYDARVSPNTLQRLRNDPALRLNDRGRTLIRGIVMSVSAVEQIDHMAAELPHHCRITVAELATDIGRAWANLADRLNEAIDAVNDDDQTAS